MLPPRVTQQRLHATRRPATRPAPSRQCIAMTGCHGVQAVRQPVQLNCTSEQYCSTCSANKSMLCAELRHWYTYAGLPWNTYAGQFKHSATCQVGSLPGSPPDSPPEERNQHCKGLGANARKPSGHCPRQLREDCIKLICSGGRSKSSLLS